MLHCSYKEQLAYCQNKADIRCGTAVWRSRETQYVYITTYTDTKDADVSVLRAGPSELCGIILSFTTVRQKIRYTLHVHACSSSASYAVWLRLSMLFHHHSLCVFWVKNGLSKIISFHRKDSMWIGTPSYVYLNKDGLLIRTVHMTSKKSFTTIN